MRLNAQKIFKISATALSVVGYGLFVFAAAPTGGYVPGQTNDPACAPGSTDCIVQSGWLLTGNTGTNATNNFIGTKDAQDFVIKTNSDETARFNATLGSVAIGHAIPVNAIFPGSLAVAVPTASGLGSYAVGSGSVASGLGSFAMGLGSVINGATNTASGTASFAIGLSNNVTATNNFAFGEENSVMGTNGDSYAFGEQNSVTSASGDAYAFGVTNDVSGEGAFAIGRDNISSAQFSMAVGFGSTASGNNSLALGSGATASGMYSTAFQQGIASGSYSISGGFMGTEASGTGSMAFGQANTASGAGSVVLNGDASIASGLQAFAMQQGNTASGINSTAFGVGNNATGDGSFAFGYNTVASGLYATAFGGASTASGTLSAAFGDSTTASGNAATAFGLFTTASGSISSAFGATTIARSYGETAIGTINTDYTPVSTDTFDPADRLFIVGNGDGIASDAFTILKNGKTGIGYDNFELTSSAALLQVNGGILSSALTGCQVVTTDANGLMSCGTVPGSLIGSTSGVVGNSTPTVSQETWLGNGAGANVASKEYTVFVGMSAGDGATNVIGSNFIGNLTGTNAINASQSNFFGTETGSGATGASQSNFFGYRSGLNATGAHHSNFMGLYSGYGATNAYESNFLGYAAGFNATGANNSIFMGTGSGNTATAATASIFLGIDAGYHATNASFANFIGVHAGDSATHAAESNFIGDYAGYGATNASYATFIGASAGSIATNAKNSIFIGFQAGNNDTVNNMFNADDFSILIGKNTSTGGFSNSIAIGDSATNTAANQLMIGSSNRPINDLVITGAGFTTCTVDTGTGAGISCSSDERLKKNITDLSSNILDTVTQLKTVHYNWINGTDHDTHIGFLAQDIQQYYPELVSTAPNGYLQVNYAGITPVLVEAIRELNIKISDIQKVADGMNATFLDNLRNWLANTANKITRIHVDQEICIGNTCINENELSQFKHWQVSTGYGYGYGMGTQ